MKSKFISVTAVALFVSIILFAQQSPSTKGNPFQAHGTGFSAPDNYTYKVFQAPNNNFGYDIFRNGKIIYHEFARMNPPANVPLAKGPNASKSNNNNVALTGGQNFALSKKEHADKAALLAIEKIKRKEVPTLTPDELKKITGE